MIYPTYFTSTTKKSVTFEIPMAYVEYHTSAFCCSQNDCPEGKYIYIKCVHGEVTCHTISKRYRNWLIIKLPNVASWFFKKILHKMNVIHIGCDVCCMCAYTHTTHTYSMCLSFIYIPSNAKYYRTFNNWVKRSPLTNFSGRPKDFPSTIS